ncbi:MAG: hypothetical protein WBF15_18750, partial [Candidatus Sulfotelmatobacter sp.]
PDSIRLEVQPTSTGHCSMRFSPAASLRARITGVRLNGRALPFHIEANSSDQHVTVNVPIVSGESTVEIQMKNNFELGETSTLPELGGTSRGLRVLSESWSPKRDTLTLLLSGMAGQSYELSAWNPDQISSVQGADLDKKTGTEAKVHVQIPASPPRSDPRATVVFHFAAR